jgi:hypothetical protein
MKLFLSLICTLIYSSVVISQTIERKIIIEGNLYFYTTIDEETQIGTLHTDSISRSFKKAKKLALPAGRNYRQPVNPFSWDIKDSLMYAISFLDHPLNNKQEALKRFPLSSLQEWNDSITAMDLIMKSVDQNMFAYNDPYKFIKKQSNILNGFQFDGIVLHDSSYALIIANNNQLSIWNYVNKQWKHTENQPFVIDSFFSLFEHDEQLYIILNNGNVHKVSAEKVLTTPDKITNQTLAEHTLILDRDKNTIQLIKNNELNMQMPLHELIEKKAISIF